MLPVAFIAFDFSRELTCPIVSLPYICLLLGLFAPLIRKLTQRTEGLKASLRATPSEAGIVGNGIPSVPPGH